MSSDIKKNTATDPVKTKAQWRINHYVGLVFIFVIFLAVNFIGFKNFHRQAFSLTDYTRLSEQTENIIRALPAPLEIINYVNPQGDPMAGVIGMDVEKILQEYRYQSGGNISVRKVDPYLDFEQARATAIEYHITTEENALIMRYEENHRVINYRDLAEIDMQAGEASPIRAFKAEQVITGAIQELAFGEQAVIYFVTGHGELDPLSADTDLAGYSLLASFVNRQNAKVEILNLRETPAIPEDAAMLVIAGPRQPFSEFEIELIKEYIEDRKENPGRLFLMLDQGTRTGLETLLVKEGIIFNDDLAIFQASILGQLRLVPQAIASAFSEHPVTEWLLKSRTGLDFGRARSLTIAEPTNGQGPRPLAMTSEHYWGETEYGGESARYEPDQDTAGPLNLVAAVDRGQVAGGEVQLQGTKILAVGSASFLSNRVLDQQGVDFFLNGMNWLLGREESLGISPKQPQDFRVTLTESQRGWMFRVVFALPVLALAAGWFVWWCRRK